MPEQDDLFIAFHALQRGDVTREQLLDALYAMAEDRTTGRPGRALGTILTQKGHLSQSHLKEIISSGPIPGAIPEEATRGDSIKLGQLLAMSGVVTYTQVMEALLQQEVGRDQGQPRMRLGEYLVSMGYTTPQAIHRALSYQHKAVYKCTKCHTKFNIVNAQANQFYQCVRCQGPLVPETEEVKVEESAVVEPVPGSGPPPPMTPIPLESDTVPMDRVQTERAIMQYLRQNQIVSDTTLRDAEHWQLEIAQFGLHAPILDILRRTGVLRDDVVRQIKQMDFSKAVDTRQVIPGYRIIGRVTSGPTSAIYSAQPQFTPGPIGLKILHLDLSRDEAQVARFKHDASLLIRFDHPCLVKGYEYGSVTLRGPGGPSAHYLTMEYVRGTSLDQIIRVKGKLSPTRAVVLALDMAQALRYLEREGFVHGDVRPEHVLVDERHRGRIIDVGVTSPLAAAGKTDGRIAEDVFALGKLLRAMLTGRTGADERPSSDLGSVNISAALLGVIRSMLHPDPTRRFQHFADLVPVLQATVEPGRDA